MSQVWVQTEKFSARSARSIILYPYFQNGGINRYCDGQYAP